MLAERGDRSRLAADGSVAVLTTPQLLRALDRRRERLHALPGVVGTGVGLRGGRPVVEISVAGPGDERLERAIREIADFDFVVVPHSEPAEAQTSGDAASETATRERGD